MPEFNEVMHLYLEGITLNTAHVSNRLCVDRDMFSSWEDTVGDIPENAARINCHHYDICPTGFVAIDQRGMDFTFVISEDRACNLHRIIYQMADIPNLSWVPYRFQLYGEVYNAMRITANDLGTHPGSAIDMFRELLWDGLEPPAKKPKMSVDGQTLNIET